MRLVTFRDGGADRIGVLAADPGDATVIDLSRAAPELPQTMRGLLTAGADALTAVAAVRDRYSGEHAVELSSLSLRPPVADPEKLIAIGLNYVEHDLEGGQPIPEVPVVFAKFPSCLIGSGEPIRLPRVANEMVDYEGELAVVIGRRCRDVSEADALDCVGGYAVFNDVSARDYQRRTSQWTIGKTFDTFGPMGPVLTTADEVGDPQTLEIETTVNGERRQFANTRDMIFPVAHLVAYLSNVMTLVPGDVIATGTPGGVGSMRKPSPSWLGEGDVVRVRIERLGTLENTVRG